MEQQQQQRERKVRLNKMRERTKELLRNHDWERYFPMAVEISSSNVTPNSKNNNRLNCSLSAINHLDYDSLLMQTNINNNIVNNINQTPNNNNNKFQLNVMPFLVNTTSQKAINKEENKTKSASTKRNRTQPKKPKRMVAAAESTGDEDEEGNYRLNMVPRGIRPSLLIKPVVCSSPCPQRRQQTPHQSFTFIAELAQTSTPTRNTQAPITSTPKQLTHDPLKYHPKQTIRCKKTSCCPIPQTTTTNRVVKQQQCVKCVKPRPTITSNKRKRSESCNNSSSDWDCNLCNISNVVNSMAVAVATSAKKKSRAVKIKTSHIEISLQDLLYAPTKSTKFDLVTTSRPRVRKQHSKVYYL